MYFSFLAIDIAGSTIIKHGAIPENITTTFNNYHSFIKSLVKENDGVVVAISGDGVMAQFDSPDQAVSCACEIQEGMKEFNEKQNKLEWPVRLRIGISAGEIDKSTVTGHDADFLLDAAGTLQKYGIPGNVHIAWEAYQDLKKYRNFFRYFKYSEVLKTDTYINKPMPHWSPDIVGNAGAVHYNRGYELLDKKNYAEAEKEFRIALKEADKENNLKLISSCLHGLGYALGRQRKNKEKIPYTLRQIKIEKQLGNEKKLYISYRNIFYAYKWHARNMEREQKFNEALKYYKKALKAAETVNDEYLIKQATVDLKDLESYFEEKKSKAKGKKEVKS